MRAGYTIVVIAAGVLVATPSSGLVEIVAARRAHPAPAVGLPPEGT